MDWDIKVCGDVSEEQREDLRQWVQAWNQQYVSTVETVPAQYLAQAVQTSSTPLRRLLLEVFQYLSTKEVELLVGLTCKAWFHVSRDSEYWKTRFMQEFQPETTEALGCFRAQFLICHRGSCWHCKEFLSLDSIELMCPLHRRPLCKACKDEPVCSLMDVERYILLHDISPSLPKYLEIPTFKLEGVKRAYKEIAIDRFTVYASRRREKLVNCLLERHSKEISPAVIEGIRTFGVEAEYRRIISTSPLMKFLGKCDEKENFQRSVQALARQFADTGTI